MARYGWLILVVGLLVVLVLLIISRGSLSSLETEKDAAEQQVSSLSSQLSQAQTEKSQLQAELDDTNADLDAANSELADIKTVFPPTSFSSPSELENWLASNAVSEQPITNTFEDWYSKAMQLQRDAFSAGYIVSVDFDYDVELDALLVFCVTVIDGVIWFWDPEFDDVFALQGLDPVG